MTNTASGVFRPHPSAIRRDTREAVTIIGFVGFEYCEVISGAFREGVEWWERKILVPVNELIILHEIGDRKYV